MPRIRIGIIGCGSITQIMHLPYLWGLRDSFEIAGLCDVSPRLLNHLGDDYGVKRRTTDYRELLQGGLDAVLIATTGSHAPCAVAAAGAGVHVLVEKPMCYTLREADAVLDAVRQAGVKLMVAHMKRYDPGYRYGREQVRQMTDLRYIQVHHFHPHNHLYLAHHPVARFDDVPPEVWQRLRDEDEALVSEAVGAEAPQIVRQAYRVMINSMIHDASNLHGLMGPPERVAAADIWKEGRCISALLQYPGDVRCVCAWIDVPDLRDFRQELSFYGSNRRVHICFPSPFLRSAPTPVVVQGMEDGVCYRKEILVSYEEAFKQELRHFHDCITNDRQPETSAEESREHLLLFQDIVRRYLGA